MVGAPVDLRDRSQIHLSPRFEAIQKEIGGMTMNSEELIQLMKQVEEKGISWDTVSDKIKVPHQILNLYANSGPVPVTIINSLKKVLEGPAQ